MAGENQTRNYGVILTMSHGGLRLDWFQARSVAEALKLAKRMAGVVSVKWTGVAR